MNKLSLILHNPFQLQDATIRDPSAPLLEALGGSTCQEEFLLQDTPLPSRTSQLHHGQVRTQGTPWYPVVCAMTSITNLDLGVVGDTAQDSLFEAGPLENLSLVCGEVLGLLQQVI